MPTDDGDVPVARNPDWVRGGIAPTVPNAGRMYNYWLDAMGLPRCLQWTTPDPARSLMGLPVRKVKVAVRYYTA